MVVKTNRNITLSLLLLLFCLACNPYKGSKGLNPKGMKANKAPSQELKEDYKKATKRMNRKYKRSMKKRLKRMGTKPE